MHRQAELRAAVIWSAAKPFAVAMPSAAILSGMSSAPAKVFRVRAAVPQFCANRAAAAGRARAASATPRRAAMTPNARLMFVPATHSAAPPNGMNAVRPTAAAQVACQVVEHKWYAPISVAVAEPVAMARQATAVRRPVDQVVEIPNAARQFVRATHSAAIRSGTIFAPVKVLNPVAALRFFASSAVAAGATVALRMAVPVAIQTVARRQSAAAIRSAATTHGTTAVRPMAAARVAYPAAARKLSAAIFAPAEMHLQTTCAPTQSPLATAPFRTQT